MVVIEGRVKLSFFIHQEVQHTCTVASSLPLIFFRTNNYDKTVTCIAFISSGHSKKHFHAQECEDPSYVAVLASHVAHRAVNKAVASNVINDYNDSEKREEEENGKRKTYSRALSLCEQASEFLASAIRLDFALEGKDNCGLWMSECD